MITLKPKLCEREKRAKDNSHTHAWNVAISFRSFIRKRGKIHMAKVLDTNACLATSQSRPRGSFLESPENFSGPK